MNWHEPQYFTVGSRVVRRFAGKVWHGRVTDVCCRRGHYSVAVLWDGRKAAYWMQTTKLSLEEGEPEYQI